MPKGTLNTQEWKARKETAASMESQWFSDRPLWPSLCPVIPLFPLHAFVDFFSGVRFRPHRSTTYVDAAYCYRPSSVVEGVARNLFWVGINFYCTILQSDIQAAWRHRLQLVHNIIFRDWFWEGIYTDKPPVATPLLRDLHGRPLDIEYQWIRNGTGVMVRKPPYSFKRLVNVYEVRLNVYKIKR